MNFLDIMILFLLFSFFLIGFKRGVIREVVSLLGIIIVFIASYLLKDYVGNYLCLYAPFIHFHGGETHDRQ